jgi:hypothetical protein
MPFFQAYRPYSFAGRRVFDALKYSIAEERDSAGDRFLEVTQLRPKRSGETIDRQAMETARLNLELYDAAFDSR